MMLAMRSYFLEDPIAALTLDPLATEDNDDAPR